MEKAILISKDEKDSGESQMYEITPAELWHLQATQAYHCDRIGSHAKHYFKQCTIYENSSGGRTILMREDHHDGNGSKKEKATR